MTTKLNDLNAKLEKIQNQTECLKKFKNSTIVYGMSQK